MVSSAKAEVAPLALKRKVIEEPSIPKDTTFDPVITNKSVIVPPDAKPVLDWAPEKLTSNPEPLDTRKTALPPEVDITMPRLTVSKQLHSKNRRCRLIQMRIWRSS